MDPLTAIAVAPIAANGAALLLDTAATAVNSVGHAFSDVLSSARHQVPAQPPRSAWPIDSSNRVGEHRAISRQLLALITGRNGVAYGQPLSTDDIQQQAMTAYFRLRDSIRSRLESYGHAAPRGPITLRVVDPQGTVKAYGDAATASAVTELLANDPQLVAQFRQTAALVQLAEAVAEHARFARSYARDSEQAMSDFAHLMGAYPHQLPRLTV